MSRPAIPAPPQRAPDTSQAGSVQPVPQPFAHQCLEAAIRGVCVLAVLSLLLTLLLGLSGCGPGTGGTGVGPVASTPVAIVYSASTTAPAATSTASVAAPVPSAAPVTAPVTAPAPAVLACTVNCTATSTVTLLVEADRVVLQGGCFNFTSQAPLAVAASGSALLAGTYQKFSTQGGQVVTTSTPANLFLQFANGQADSPSVTLSVRATAGTVLFGPVTLPRASGATPSDGSSSSGSAAAGSGASACP